MLKQQTAAQVFSKMMDLDEARVSLDLYADLLDLQRRQHSLAIGLMGADKNANQLDPRAIALRDRAVADLRRTEKEALVLSTLILEAITQESKRLVLFPHQLTKLLEAQNRITAASDNASNLLRTHDEKEAKKNAPEKPSASDLVVRRFMEEHGLV